MQTQLEAPSNTHTPKTESAWFQSLVRLRHTDRLMQKKQKFVLSYDAEISRLKEEISQNREERSAKEEWLEITSCYVADLNPADRDYEQANIRLSLVEAEMDELVKQGDILEEKLKKLEKQRQEHLEITEEEQQEIELAGIGDEIYNSILKNVIAIENIRDHSQESKEKIKVLLETVLEIKHVHDQLFPNNKLRAQVLYQRALDHQNHIHPQAVKRMPHEGSSQESTNAMEVSSETDSIDHPGTPLTTDALLVSPPVAQRSIPLKIVSLHRKYPDF